MFQLGSSCTAQSVTKRKRNIQIFIEFSIKNLFDNLFEKKINYSSRKALVGHILHRRGRFSRFRPKSFLYPDPGYLAKKQLGFKR